MCLLCAFLRLQENLGEQIHLTYTIYLAQLALQLVLMMMCILPGVSFILFLRSVLHIFHIDDR